MQEPRSFTLEMGQRLKGLRISARLSQDELADRIGLTGPARKTGIWRLETGRIRNPSLRTINRYLGMSSRSHFWLLRAIDFPHRTERDQLSHSALQDTSS